MRIRTESLLLSSDTDISTLPAPRIPFPATTVTDYGMTSYTGDMKTAISIPDGDFERFERVAARHGMNRSEFFRRAGRRLADELEGEAELTALANSVIERVGEPSSDSPFLPESQRIILEGTERLKDAEW